MHKSAIYLPTPAEPLPFVCVHLEAGGRRARTLSCNVTFGEPWSNLIYGWKFQKTLTTDDFSGEAVREQLPEDACMVAVVVAAGGGGSTGFLPASLGRTPMTRR